MIEVSIPLLDRFFSYMFQNITLTSQKQFSKISPSGVNNPFRLPSNQACTAGGSGIQTPKGS